MPQVYDSLNEEKVVQSLAPAAVTGTVSGYVVNGTNARYIVHEIAMGAVTTLDGSNYLSFAVNESDAITNGTTLNGGSALPTANVLGVERVVGAGYLLNFPKVTEAYPLVVNDSTKFATGGVARIVTLKNKTYQQLVGTATGSPSAILGAVAKICGYGVVPAV